MNFTEISLSILYLLKETNFPLKFDQISDAFAEVSDYTYIEASIAVSNLLEKEYLLKEETPQGEQYSITVEGRIALNHMKSDIRASLRRNLLEYVKTNFLRMSLESNITSHISALDNGFYQVHLQAYDNDFAMKDFFIDARSEEEAKLIASNWEKSADDAIAQLYAILLKDM